MTQSASGFPSGPWPRREQAGACRAEGPARTGESGEARRADPQRGIVRLRSAPAAGTAAPDLYESLVADAVALTRATRRHPDVRQGSSVRGAIDLTLVATQLSALRGVHRPRGEGGPAGIDAAGNGIDRGGGGSVGDRVDGSERARIHDPVRAAYAETVYDAMLVALSGRIFVDEAADITPEAVLREIWEDHFVLSPAAARPG